MLLLSMYEIVADCEDKKCYSYADQTANFVTVKKDDATKILFCIMSVNGGFTAGFSRSKNRPF